MKIRRLLGLGATLIALVVLVSPQAVLAQEDDLRLLGVGDELGPLPLAMVLPAEGRRPEPAALLEGLPEPLLRGVADG